MMHFRATFAICTLGLTVFCTTAYAADAVTKASVRQQSSGNPMAKIWISGRGFQAGSTVMISGDGITELNPPTVVPEAMRRDGGTGDGIIYDFSIAANASLGTRDITVTAPGGQSATGMGILEIIAGMGSGPADQNQQQNNMPNNNDNQMANQGMDVGQKPMGSVDQVTRASPYYMELGAQVNIWVVGKGFAPGAQITFSNPGIQPARDARNQPLPVDVYKNVPSEAGALDGIQYFAVVGPPETTALGFVNVTVTNPDGSMATGQNLMEIVPAGMLPERRPGQGNIDSITGASPMVAGVGKKVAMWIWGKGIATGAQVTFSNPAIRAFRPSEVVEQSQSHPGYSGIRNFLQIDPNAIPGPVSITIRNPNGTTQMLPNGFQIVPDGGITGPNSLPSNQGNCPDLTTSIGPITAINPTTIGTGQMVTLQIQGQAFACGCQVVIPGGGIRALEQPLLARDPFNPLLTTLTWSIYVEPGAELGQRDLQIINPNGSSQVAPRVLTIVEGQGIPGQQAGFQPGVATPNNGATGISMMAPGQPAGGAMADDDEASAAAGGCSQVSSSDATWPIFGLFVGLFALGRKRAFSW